MDALSHLSFSARQSRPAWFSAVHPVVVTISESEEQSALQLVEVPQSSFCRAQMAEQVAAVFDPFSSSPLQALVPRRVNNIVIAALRSIVVVSI